MQYIVLDLEWNQALSRNSMRHKGIVVIGEIIQIGAVRLDEKDKKTGQIRINVAPKYYKKMHWSVRKLTGISTKSLKEGLPFPAAFEQFMEWCGNDVTFLTWGPDDLPMLRDNLRLHGMNPNLLPPSYDLQRIFARQIAGEKRQFSLSDAMEQLGVVRDEPAHDALNDAIHTSAVCKKLDLTKGIAEYDLPFPARVSNRNTENAPPRTIYPSYEEMAETEFGTPCICPNCEKELSVGKWVRRAPGKRISLGVCACGAEYILKIRWTMDPETEHVFVTRSVDEATKEQKDAYQRALTQKRRPHGHRSHKRADKKPVPTA